MSDLGATLSRPAFAFGGDARDRFTETGRTGAEGAVAAAETFYRALNRQDLDLLTSVWHDDDLVQVDNPVGGVIRSRAQVRDLYSRVFSSGIDLQVTFRDVMQVTSRGCVVLAGREEGSYAASDERVPLSIRTTRIFTWSDGSGRWAQAHHHGSIDNAEALAEYQRVVTGG